MTQAHRPAHHPETAASTELCSSDCAPCVAALVALASPAVDHIQVGSSDVQSSEHVHSGLPTPPNRRTCPQPNFMFICHPAAGPTVHENTDFSRRDFRFCFQHRLSATRCHSSVILFLNPDLKLFCSIRLLPNTDPTCRQRLRPYSAIEIRLLCPRPRGALSDDARDDVCLSRTSGLN